MGFLDDYPTLAKYAENNAEIRETLGEPEEDTELKYEHERQEELKEGTLAAVEWVKNKTKGVFNPILNFALAIAGVAVLAFITIGGSK